MIEYIDPITGRHTVFIPNMEAMDDPQTQWQEAMGQLSGRVITQVIINNESNSRNTRSRSDHQTTMGTRIRRHG